MIEDYFNFLIDTSRKKSFVKDVKIIKMNFSSKKGFLRFKIYLNDGSELHIFEYVDDLLNKISYSYHWQDKEKLLIKRWDNAPHHKEIETFPDHLHQENNVFSAIKPTLFDILKDIENKI